MLSLMIRIIDDYSFYYVDGDHTPSLGNTNNGPPIYSYSISTENNSNTAHANLQTALGNHMTGNNIPNKPPMLAPESSYTEMTGNSNNYLPVVSFRNSVTMTESTNS